MSLGSGCGPRQPTSVCHIDMPCHYAIILDMTTARTFHVPLAESTYREIAEQLRRPATQLGREAIESWLKEARRASIAEAIQAYAEQSAGTAADLDEALENASIEYLGSPDGHEAFEVTAANSTGGLDIFQSRLSRRSKMDSKRRSAWCKPWPWPERGLRATPPCAARRVVETLDCVDYRPRSTQ